jgi:hypothetical protein
MSCNDGFVIGFAFGAVVAAGACILIAVGISLWIVGRPPRIEIETREP